MSMSMHVVGFRPADEKWKQMKSVYDACTAAGIDPPHEVQMFFDWSKPDESGIEVSLSKHDAVARYTDDSSEGYEIDISKLPPNITKIRFFCSW